MLSKSPTGIPLHIKKEKKIYTYLSLFCGCGGFDLGMVEFGINGLAAYDINKFAIAVYNNNLPGIGIVCDLAEPPDFIGMQPDIIISGSPCQGFSTAGKMVLGDPRNKLFLKSIDIALTIRPKIFIAENVVGILSGEHKTEYMDKAIQLLEENGYRTNIIIADCRELGMAQMRKRALLFAWNTKKTFLIPRLSSCSKTIRDVIYNMPNDLPNHDVEKCSAIGSNLCISRHIKPGQKLCNVRKGDRSVHTWDIPEVFGNVTAREREVLEAMIRVRRKCRTRKWGDSDPVTIKSLEEYLGFDPIEQILSLRDKKFLKNKNGDKVDLTNSFNGKYRRLKWDSQSFTVDTRFGSPVQFLHPSEHRAFTVREAARLQGFPDTFLFDGPLATQYAMVGNAVPPPLSKFAAQIALNLLS